MLLFPLRFRRLLRGALPVLLLLVLAGDAFAFGRRCGNGGTVVATDRGGPARNLLGGIVDRAQARRDARAGGCQQPAPVAFPAAPPAAYSAVTYTVGGCVGGVCPTR